MIEKSLKLLFLILKLNNEIAIVFIPDSTIEEIRMNLIQAFSPLTKIWAWIPHPYGMGLKYIWLSALSGNGYVCYTPNHVPGMTINH